MQYKYRINIVGRYSRDTLFSGTYTLNLSKTSGDIAHRLGLSVLFSNGNGNADSKNLIGFQLKKKNGLYELYDQNCVV